MSIQRSGGTIVAIWRTLPMPARVVVGIVGVLAVLYLWQLVIGLFFLAALAVGTVQIVRWFVSQQ